MVWYLVKYKDNFTFTLPSPYKYSLAKLELMVMEYR
jgi:hypothetical protein